MDQEQRLKGQLIFFRWLSSLLGLALAIFLIHSQISVREEGRPFGSNTIIEPAAPFAREIAKIISPLRYTGLYDFMNVEVFISIDTERQTWTLNNIHNFDEQGRLLLTDNRYGLCGDLAAYTHERVKSFFDSKRFDLSYLLVAESSYFSSGNGTHVILQILDREAPGGPRYYLLDPAFRKYGSRHLFGTYRVLEEFYEMQHVRQKIRGQSFEAGGGPPIHINSRVMLSLYLLPVDDKFDSENFTIALSARKRYDYQNNRLFTRTVRDGKSETRESNPHILPLLRPGIYEKLRARVIEISDRVRESEDPFWNFEFPTNYSYATGYQSKAARAAS